MIVFAGIAAGAGLGTLFAATAVPGVRRLEWYATMAVLVGVVIVTWSLRAPAFGMAFGLTGAATAAVMPAWLWRHHPALDGAGPLMRVWIPVVRGNVLRAWDADERRHAESHADTDAEADRNLGG